MKRVLVNIVSEQTVPNYLFIKEMIQEGDELLFISSKLMENKIDPIVNTLQYTNCTIQSIVFSKDNDEESWNNMSDQIKDRLDRNIKYLVNLTGGTKYISLAIQAIFEEYDSAFYYIPFPKNYILQLRSKFDTPIPISHRIGVDEYVSLYNLKIKKKTTTQSTEYTIGFFYLFTSDNLSEFDLKIIDCLRNYRVKNIDIGNIETLDPETEKYPRIENLQKFLNMISFPVSNYGKLSKYEIQYITGGWFEEYVFHLLKEKLNPTDIQIGVEIEKTKETEMNDLDIVFTLGNKLFVVECKTGIGKVSLFKQIVYKASALKEYLLGLSATSYVFSLTGEEPELKKSAQNMGVNYIDRTYFINNVKMDELIRSIQHIGN